MHVDAEYARLCDDVEAAFVIAVCCSVHKALDPVAKALILDQLEVSSQCSSSRDGRCLQESPS